MKDESRAKIEEFDFELQRIVIKYLYGTSVTPYEVEEYYKEANDFVSKMQDVIERRPVRK